MNIKTCSAFLLALLAALLLASCAANDPYDRGLERGTAANDGYGYVRDIDQVAYKKEGIGLGAVIGGVAGAALGSQVGDGSGQKAATVAGAVGGAVAGHQIEKNRRGQNLAWQYTVDLDNGRIATVTQVRDAGVREGDRVRVVGDTIVPVR